MARRLCSTPHLGLTVLEPVDAYPGARLLDEHLLGAGLASFGAEVDVFRVYRLISHGASDGKMCTRHAGGSQGTW